MYTLTDSNGPDGAYLTGRANVWSDPGCTSLLMPSTSLKGLCSGYQPLLGLIK